jgi:hypothetical protein
MCRKKQKLASLVFASACIAQAQALKLETEEDSIRPPPLVGDISLPIDPIQFLTVGVLDPDWVTGDLLDSNKGPGDNDSGLSATVHKCSAAIDRIKRGPSNYHKI